MGSSVLPRSSSLGVIRRSLGDRRTETPSEALGDAATTDCSHLLAATKDTLNTTTAAATALDRLIEATKKSDEQWNLALTTWWRAQKALEAAQAAS